MQTKRDIGIDLLRGFSMIIVIVLHVMANYLNQKDIFYVWDYLHFAVAAFIFCSAYIFFGKTLKKSPSTPISFSYIGKRFQRLYLPYLFFVFIVVILRLIFETRVITADYLLANILVIGGIDINWLVLLFIQFIVLFSLLSYSYHRYRTIFWIYSLLAFLSSIFLFFYSVPFHWKWIMWIPWSLVALYSIAYIHYDWRRNWIIPVITFGLLTCAGFIIQYGENNGIGLSIHKYPPDFLFISYGLFVISILYPLFSRQFMHSPIISAPLSFFSTFSYQLYFIHYLTLYIGEQFQLSQIIPWYLYTAAIIVTTAGIQKAFILVSRFVRH
ncbi:MAG: acyltransferase family protein [Patescibacteria group bacterium]